MPNEKINTSKKHITAWGIKTGDLLLPYSIRDTRKIAIMDISRDMQCTWPTLKKWGYSFVKLSIQEQN